MRFGWWKTIWLWITGKCPLCGADIQPANGAFYYEGYWECSLHCGYRYRK